MLVVTWKWWLKSNPTFATRRRFLPTRFFPEHPGRIFFQLHPFRATNLFSNGRCQVDARLTNNLTLDDFETKIICRRKIISAVLRITLRTIFLQVKFAINFSSFLIKLPGVKLAWRKMKTSTLHRLELLKWIKFEIIWCLDKSMMRLSNVSTWTLTVTFSRGILSNEMIEKVNEH